MKYPVEVRPPGSDFLFVVLCMDMSGNRVSLALLDDLPLDLPHSPEITSKLSPTSCSRSACQRCDSRRQLLDCLAHGVVKVVQPLPVQTSVQGGTDVSAGQPKFDVICIVDHGVLGALWSAFVQQKVIRELTLIVARITLTEPKTALAGVILESSFARFKASMVAFNAEIVLSRPLGRRDSASIVETRGSCEGGERGEDCEEDPERR